MATPAPEIPDQKVARFETSLQQLLERLAEDRCVLAVVQVGQLQPETIWRRESLHLWIIEADGVTRRLLSDGNEERIFRTLTENGVNIHAELIPRSRFKQMVEGASRTAFSCNFFSHRRLIYSRDPSIAQWFQQANTVAIKDQERELMIFSTWTIHAHRHAHKRLEWKGDLELAQQETLEAAHSIACTEVIRHGSVWEDDVIYFAMERNPDLFQVIYLEVVAQRTRQSIANALSAMDGYLGTHFRAHLRPLLSYLRRQNRVVPLSEIGDFFAYSQVYPWHLESVCEWLARKGRLEKISTLLRLTKRSPVDVEEPAYFLDPATIDG